VVKSIFKRKEQLSKIALLLGIIGAEGGSRTHTSFEDAGF